MTQATITETRYVVTRGSLYLQISAPPVEFGPFETAQLFDLTEALEISAHLGAHTTVCAV